MTEGIVQYGILYIFANFLTIKMSVIDYRKTVLFKKISMHFLFLISLFFKRLIISIPSVCFADSYPY